MKKYLLIISLLISSVSLFAQDLFSSNMLTYRIINLQDNYVEVKKQEPEFNNANVQTLEIPSTVTYNDVEYTVTKIADYGFQNSNELKIVKIPNTVTTIGVNAFQSCAMLEEVDLGTGVSSIGAYAFQGCHRLHSILLPAGITTIENYTFENCHGLNEIIIPAGVTSIGDYAFHNVHSIEVIFLGSGNVTISTNAFTNCNNVHIIFMNPELLTINDTDGDGNSNVSIFGNNARIHAPCGCANAYYVSTNNGTVIDETDCVRTTRQSGLFCLPETWVGYDSWSSKTAYETASNKEAWLETNGYPNFMPRNPNHPFYIRKNHIVRLTHKRHIYPFNSINEGVLRIEVGGELIERDTLIVDDGWRPDVTITGGENNSHATGADLVYMNENLGGEIEIVAPAQKGKWNFIGAPLNGYDLWAVKIGPGGKDVTIVEFEYGNGLWSNNYSTIDSVIQAGEGFLAWPFYDGGVVFSTKRDYGEQTTYIQPIIMEADFGLNHQDVVLTKTITTTQGDNIGNWMALSNPYPAKLCVKDFLTENNNSPQSIQGDGIYVHNSTDNSFSFVTKEAGYDLGVCQGFFVNFSTPGTKTINFRKNQLHEYNEPQHQKTTSISQKEYIKLSLFEGEKETELLLAHNQEAEQGYDIYDANKLFSMEKITEPYFLTDGIALVKEEIKELPYYATMNVRTYKDTVMSFVMKEIPSELKVFLIDGEEMIDMSAGSTYTTEFFKGENNDRFKLFVRKADALDLDGQSNISITNCNRLINIQSKEDNLQIEVYNALGQKVYETKDYNFTLNNLSVGAYIVKAFNNIKSQSSKVIIK